MPIYKKPQAETPSNIPWISNKDLAEIVSRNINVLCPSRQHPKKTIAQICHVSPSLVSSWTAAKNPQLPGVHYLLMIAEYFGVDISYLVTYHGDDFCMIPGQIRTYSDALVMLIQLVHQGILTTEHVEDLILKYLLERFFYLANIGLSVGEFNDWVEKILRDFSVPLTISHNDEYVFRDISENEEGIAAIDDDTRYRNIARTLANPEAMKRVLIRLYRKEAKYEFKKWCDAMELDMADYDDGDWPEEEDDLDFEELEQEINETIKEIDRPQCP